MKQLQSLNSKLRENAMEIISYIIYTCQYFIPKRQITKKIYKQTIS